MLVPATFYGHCCKSPEKPTHQVGRFYHMTFQNWHIAAIGEKYRQVCPHQSVAKIACDFRWRSNSPRSAYKIAKCVAGLRKISFCSQSTNSLSFFCLIHRITSTVDPSQTNFRSLLSIFEIPQDCYRNEERLLHLSEINILMR